MIIGSLDPWGKPSPEPKIGPKTSTHNATSAELLHYLSYVAVLFFNWVL